MAFATILARLLVLIKWKDKLPPTFKHWINDLMHHLVLEKICYSKQRSAFKFHAIWEPILTLREKMNPTYIAILLI